MSFSPKQFIDHKCAELIRTIDGKALIAVSGGVDSSVSAALLQRAGLRTKLIFIDSGYQRKDEPKKVVARFKEAGYDIELIDAREHFYRRTFPRHTIEDKMEAFRSTYFDTIIKYAKDKRIGTLVQGTQFYQTTTQIGHSMPNRRFWSSGIQLIEPVRGLVKDDVRALAKALKLRQDVVRRMSFPGPGILMRFYGNPTMKKIRITTKATEIVDAMLHENTSVFKHAYQVFPYLLSDIEISYINRNYKKAKGWIILVRSLQQCKTGTGYVYRPFFIPRVIEEKLVSDLMDIQGVARVCFDLSPKHFSVLKPGAGANIELT
jgi:GMP synthase (glutamine-hydrolysing)